MGKVERLLHRVTRSLPRSVAKGSGIERYYVKRGKWGGVFLHRVKRSDDRLHDHPWPAISILLTGSYRDERMHGRTRRIRRWGVNLIGHTAVHRVVIDQPVWTLFIHGPRMKGWGFVETSNPDPWRGPD